MAEILVNISGFGDSWNWLVKGRDINAGGKGIPTRKKAIEQAKSFCASMVNVEKFNPNDTVKWKMFLI